RDEFRILVRLQLGNRHAQRIVQAEPDHVARPLGLGHRQAHVPRRLADALDDRRRRIDDRAVPVEDDQPVLHSAFTKSAIAAGNGASRRRRSPVSGWLNESLPACRRRRCLSALLSAKSPYLSSPTIGCPAWERWTRIW